MAKYIQTPVQGKHCLLYCGDLLEFRIESDTVIPGAVYLMTNLGNAHGNAPKRLPGSKKASRPVFRTGTMSV